LTGSVSVILQSGETTELQKVDSMIIMVNPDPTGGIGNIHIFLVF
jgi:hypothetical protein